MTPAARCTGRAGSSRPRGSQAVTVPDHGAQVRVRPEIEPARELLPADHRVGGEPLAPDAPAPVNGRDERDIAAFRLRAGDLVDVAGEVPLLEPAVAAVLGNPAVDGPGGDRVPRSGGQEPDVRPPGEGELLLDLQARTRVDEPALMVVEPGGVRPVPGRQVRDPLINDPGVPGAAFSRRAVQRDEQRIGPGERHQGVRLPAAPGGRQDEQRRPVAIARQRGYVLVGLDHVAGDGGVQAVVAHLDPLVLVRDGRLAGGG